MGAAPGLATHLPPVRTGDGDLPAVGGQMRRQRCAVAQHRLQRREIESQAGTALRQGSGGLPPVAGLLVRAVEGDGPAGKAGIRTGDVLLRGGSHELCSIAGLYATIDDAAGCRRLDLTLLRGTEEQRVTVKLAAAGSSDAGPASAGERAARGVHSV